ncbi:unnamed protein product [Pneumocystis jirovecii]|uniref:Vacuolar protein sorting-associated protein 52 n=1 Tax=Pneumocystis jirovecii TaxID=42068 RepID=L0PEV6_PNEJI|nr:unnamed protein product [Pneumocystis jirovecii]
MTESDIFIEKIDKILMDSLEWDLKSLISVFPYSKNTSNDAKKDSNIQEILTKKCIKDLEITNELNSSIMSCNKTLDSIESYLFDLQNNLEAINNEMESLKLRSLTINQQLQVRKNTERRINDVINDFILPPETIYCISESKIDEKWLHNLSILDNMLDRFDANKKEQGSCKIQEYVEKEVEKLLWIAIGRIREFLINKIKILYTPYSNLRAIHQSLIKYKCLFTFLFKRQNQIIFEIKQTYQNIIQWYYIYHFEKYKAFLEKLEMNTFDTIVLNCEKTSKKNTAFPQKKIQVFSSYQEFDINHRASLISGENQNIIMTHISNDDKKTHNLEFVFYSYNQVLVNNIILEYLFLSEFMLFNNSQELNNYLKNLFETTLSDSKIFNQQLIENSCDIIGILLSVKTIEKLNSDLKNKEIFIFDDYINEISTLLWNQFEKSIDLHCKNLKQISIKNSLTENHNRTIPDVLTQKFGDLLNGIFIMFSKNYDKLIETNIQKLVDSLIIYLTEISNKMKNEKERKLFLYNNYSLMLAIINNTEGYLAKKQQTYFYNLQINIKKS